MQICDCRGRIGFRSRPCVSSIITTIVVTALTAVIFLVFMPLDLIDKEEKMHEAFYQQTVERNFWRVVDRSRR